MLNGAVTVALSARSFSFDNSGTINATTDGYYTYYGTDLTVGTRSGFEADAATVTNRGSINGGIAVGAAARTLAFTNSGFIGGPGIVVAQYQQVSIDPVSHIGTVADQASASFANSGTITGGAFLTSAATATTATNSGTISDFIDGPSNQRGGTAFGVATATLGSATVAVTNRGTVNSLTAGGTALSVTAAAGAMPPVAGPVATVTVANGGTLRADTGAVLFPGQGTATSPDLPFPAIALSVAAADAGTATVTITNAAGGTISAAGATTLGASYTPATPPAPAGGSSAIVVAANRVVITNAGGPGLGLSVGATVGLPGNVRLPDAYLAGAIQTIGSVDMLINARGGVITGSVDLGAFDDRVENYGRLAGNVFLRDGNDTFVGSLGGTLTATVDGGAGTNTLILDTTAGGALNQALLDRFVNFAAPVVTGNGTITAAGPLNVPTLNVTGRALTLAAGQTLSTTGPVTITTGDADVAITNLGTIGGGIAFGNGSDTLTNGGGIGASVGFGGGAVRIANSGSIGGSIAAGGGPVTLDNSGSAGAVTLGNGSDTVTNSSRLASLALGTGADAVTAARSALAAAAR